MVNKTRRIILLSLLSFAVSVVIFLSNLLGIFELKAYDLFSRYLNPARPAHDTIVIVQVDQQSIEALSREGIHWPWPRQIYAPIVEYASEADAVFMDILFTEPSSYGVEDDLMLARAMQHASRVYLPLFLTRQGKPMTSSDEAFVRSVSVSDTAAPPPSFTSALTPVDALKEATKGAGNVTIDPDGDGVYRSTPLVFRLREDTIPQFVLSYLLQKGSVRIADTALYRGDAKIPLTSGKLLLRYYTAQNPFTVFSASEVLKSYLASTTSQLPEIKKEFFKGKSVFVGLTAAGLYDLKPTPISSLSPGVLVHATALDNILNANFIQPANRIYTILFMFFICLFITYAVLRFHSIAANLSVFTGALGIVIFIPAIFFSHAFSMNIISPLVSLISSFIVSTVYSYATEGKERRFIKKTFSQYMDETLVEHVLGNPTLIKPGGQKKHVTVFFADIAGFTSIAERVSPEDIAWILHTLLNTFTEVIIECKGVIDKYIGDCIMAFWGAPLATQHDEMHACSAALRCITSLTEINNKFREKGFSEIAIRIGLHSGDAIVGNLGSDRLFDYTVVGDTVNLASRLESVNKLFKTRIIVSEETLKAAGDGFLVRELGLIEVKGKSVPVKIFELMGEKSDSMPGNEDMVELFHQGLKVFREQKWTDAMELFNRILERYPGDGPSEFYQKRCECLMAQSQLTEDCHIIKMTEK